MRLSEAPSVGQPVTVYAPNSRGAVAYQELAREIHESVSNRDRELERETL